MIEILKDDMPRIGQILAKYPNRRSGMLPLLWLVQQKLGWISQPAMAEVAEILECTTAEVYEVVSFYTMFHQHPVGRHHIAMCDTLSCAICGSMEAADYLREKYGIEKNKVTADGRFSLEYAECIGACANAPAMLLNETLVGNLTPEKLDAVLADCR